MVRIRSQKVQALCRQARSKTRNLLRLRAKPSETWLNNIAVPALVTVHFV
jgi:hypothetical protein